QSVLVPTIDDALAGIEYLKTEGLGRGAFLVVGLHGAQEDPPDYYFDTPQQNAKNEEQQPQETPGSVAPSEPGTFIQPEQCEPGDLPAQSVPLSPDQIASYFDPSYLDPAYVNPTYVNHDESTGMRFELEVLQAIDLMGLRPEIKAVVERAFPEKCAACVVPDVEAALHLSMENGWKTYITYDGDQVVNGRLLVSAARAGKEGASLLGLKRQIRELKERCAVLQKQDEELALALVASRARLDLAEAECSELDARLRQAEKTAAARISQADALAKDLERAEQHVRVVEQEREIAAEEHAELDARLALLAQELLAAEGSRNLVQHSLASSQSAFGEMRVCVERFAEQLSEARASAAARAERLRAAQSEMRRLEHEAEELNSRINIIRLELYESQSRIEELRASAAVAESESARLNAESARLGADISSLSEHLGTVRNTADELEALLSTLRLESADAHEHRGRIEVQLTKIQSEAEHLAKSCLTELGQPLSEVIASLDLEPVESIPSDTDPVTESADFIVDPAAAPQPPVAAEPQPEPADKPWFDLDAARERLDDLRTKLDEMGSVNMMALEELEEAEQRFRFLSGQRDDILKSIKGTEDALTEIKRRSREKFRHAFLRINENFQKMFVELFGGGRGEMVLIDEEDVLESGIDLIAQPPGKRLQNVLLLSGGEKAMAAIALVLSIFQFRPSPFCILDEVDAPLDEMNVGRFSEKVVEMSRETQFLMITHNKRSMEAARALYGVTMEEPGVSKLVSVRFG
ncbi:MAG TPA: hypothetical protein VKJ45_25340, partial [Blastocatellia bacterium]|nr:hypothetical protein [Blastocatellia bacterium]